MFANDYVRWTKKLAWLSGTYGRMCEHCLVGPYRGNLANTTEMFQQVTKQKATALSMDFYQPRFIYFRDHGYTIMKDLHDPDNQLFSTI